MNNFFVNNFSGGMNDWINPGLLNESMAPVLINGEVSNGKIVPLKSSVVQAGNSPLLYNHYGNQNRSLVKLFGRTYWSDNLQGTYGGDQENFLGVPYPVYTTVQRNINITRTTGNMSGQYKYCVCFVSANGWESAPGSATSYEVAVNLDNQTPMVNVVWSDPIVSYAKVYRTIDHGADFYCCATLITSGMFHVDSMSDEELQTQEPLNSFDNYPPPTGGKYLCENNGVFFLAVGTELYFSIPNNIHAWPRTNFLTFDEEITGITKEFQGVLVFTKSAVHKVVGYELENIAKIYIPGNHGCLNYRSIAVMNNAPIWLSYDGLCVWDGGTVTVLNYQRLKLDNINVNYALVANDCYYLFTNNETIVFDRKNNGVFYKLNFTCNYAWYNSANNKIYTMKNGVISLFNSGSNLEITYQTPNIGGSENRFKKFKELLFCANGSSTITVYMDDVYMCDINLTSGRQRVKLPRTFVGRYLALKVKCSDIISELAVLFD